VVVKNALKKENHLIKAYLSFSNFSKFLSALLAYSLLNAAHAQDYQPSYGYYTNQYANRMLENNFWNKHLYKYPKTKRNDSRTANAERAGSATSFRPSRSSTQALPMPGVDVAAKFASQYPAANQAEAERAYKGMLRAFNNLERKHGWPGNDAGIALAALVCASVQMLNGKHFTPDQVAATARQFQQSLTADKEFQSASPEQRRELYEEAVLMGVTLDSAFEASERSKNPASLNQLKPMARKALEKITGTRAELISIGANGMTIAQQ
jgi:hypothetical protein